MLKKKMASNIKKTLNRQSDESDCDNSYLIEIPLNDGISPEIRKKIESKYRRSRVNSVYKFPRSNSPMKLLSQKETVSSKHLSLIPSMRYPSSNSHILNLGKNTSILIRPKISQTPINRQSQGEKLLKFKASKYLPYRAKASFSRASLNHNNNLQSLTHSFAKFSQKKTTAKRRNKVNLSIN